jgi:hypothetical protein
MGTFKGTCYLSRLPISYGERVVLIPLIKPQNTEENNCCYPTDNYIPFGLPIEGYYNEYGGLENPTTIAVNIEFYKQFNYYRWIDDVTNPCNFASVEKPDSWDVFVNEILCSHKQMYVQLSKEEGGKLRIHWMMLHYDLYADVLHEISSRPIYGTGASYETVLQLRYEGVLETYKSSLEKVVNNNSENTRKEVEELIKQLKERLVQCIAYDIVSDTIIGADFKHWEYFAKILLEADEDAELLNALMKRTFFTTALSFLRNGYHCCSGWGSSSNEMHMHTIIANFILNYYQNHKDNVEYKDSVFLNS